MAKVEAAAIYIGPKASKAGRDRAYDFLHDNRRFVEGFAELGESNVILHPVGKIVSVGGEGTNGRLMQAQFEAHEPRVNGLLAAGTSNVIHGILVDAKKTMSFEDFMRAPLNEVLDRSVDLEPGLFGDQIFNNHIGTGSYWLNQGKWGERTRWIRTGLRRYAVPAFAYGETLVSFGSDKFDIYTVSPRLGKNPNAFPGQDLFDDSITHAWVEGNPAMQRANVLRALGSFLLNKDVPSEILKTEKGKTFEVRHESGHDIWRDGDTRRFDILEEGKPTPVSRSGMKFPVVALV